MKAIDRLKTLGTAQDRLTNVVVVDVDPARRADVIEAVEIATGLSTKRASTIVDTHEVIECEDYIEAKVLKEDLEAAGATVDLRESAEAFDEQPEDVPPQFTNPDGLVVAAVGVAVLVISAFLPYADASGLTFSRVAHNTMVQSGEWTVLVCAAIIAYDVVSAYIGRPRARLWAVLWAPVVTIIILIVDMANKSHFRFYPLVNGQLDTSLPAQNASPGVGFYVAIVGAVIGAGGLILSRNLTPLMSGGKKQCPDCAEAVHIDANVCKHCGYRFGSA